MHRGRHHIISIPYTDDVGIREVGIDNGVPVLAVSLVADIDILEVGVRPVSCIVVGIPVHTSLGTCLRITAKGGNDLVLFQQGINLEEVMRMCQSHGNVAKLVEHSLEGLTPFRRGSRSPRAKILIHNLSHLVILDGTILVCLRRLGLLQRTPVYFGDEDRISVNDGNGLMEGINLVGWIRVIVAGIIIPAGVVMNSIADVVALDGPRGIAAIVRLVARTGNPDDTREAIGTNLVDDGLEVVVQSLGIVLVVGIPQVDRLIGQLQAYLAGILLDICILTDDVPDV